MNTWIWYPGDFEIWLANNMQNRRTERGTFFPPFWRMDSHYVLVEFSKKLDLLADEEVEIFAEGRYNVKLDGKLLFGEPNKITIPAGKHSLNIKVHNQANVPAIFVRGKTFASDSSWQVTFEDKEWIDASGKASDTSGTTYMQAASWNFNSPNEKPSAFKLSTTPKAAVATERNPAAPLRQAQGDNARCHAEPVEACGAGTPHTDNSILVDFGQETFGFVKLHGLKGSGEVAIYYGESREEAMDKEGCETLDKLTINHAQPQDLLMDSSKALRFAYVTFDGSISLDSVSMLYEFLPLDYRGAFRCNDEELNKIWDISAYTMHLTTREFFIDGIKRDRWIWSGDAYQSFLMNYYLFFDSPSVTRTLFALRGKDPVTSHINTIMDYTFYWFMGIYDYYLHSGDRAFMAQMYPRMKSLMSYVLSRRNENGMLEGLSGDWVFIDWAEFQMSKKGEVSFEQLLFCRGLETMTLCAELLGEEKDAALYTALSQELKQKLFTKFWSKEKNAFVHNVENGKQSEQVTPYTNMFAVLLDYLNEAQTEDVRKNALKNPNALKITTPYMRFYELEALCKMGEQSYVTQEMKSYWGGMLREGATSFWEKYAPNENGREHLAMYGRPYGRSLCHAWGASPIYLFGKYYLGVTPTQAGYSEFSIAPNLGGLKWIDGKVPTPNGDISVYMNEDTIRVKADSGKGYLYFSSEKTPTANLGTVEKVKGNKYKLIIESGKQYEVKY